MGKALQRLMAHLPHWPSWPARKAAHEDQEHPEIGDFHADYGPIPREQLAKTDPELEELLQRSKVVSGKRGLRHTCNGTG